MARTEFRGTINVDIRDSDPDWTPFEPRWIQKYTGRFDAGYEAMRDQTLARQKQLGLVPGDTQLPPVNPIGTPETPPSVRVRGQAPPRRRRVLPQPHRHHSAS